VEKFEMNPDKIAETLKDWFVSKKHEVKETSIKAKSLGRADVRNIVLISKLSSPVCRHWI